MGQPEEEGYKKQERKEETKKKLREGSAMEATGKSISRRNWAQGFIDTADSSNRCKSNMSNNEVVCNLVESITSGR